MTLDEFFQELERIFSQPGGQARISPSGGLLVRLPSTPTPHLPIDPPICAVEFELHTPTSPHWLSTAWRRASEALDLRLEDAAALDAATWAEPDHNPALRTRLLQAVGLPASSSSAPAAA